MIFAHGKLLPDTDLPALLDTLETEINTTRATLTLETELVLSALDALLGKLDRGELDELITQYAPPGAREELEQLRPLLSRPALEARLDLELNPEPFAPKKRPFGRTKLVPLGTLFHVAAGNQPGLPAFSVAEGLLTGNVNLLKLPRADKGLSLAILNLLVETQPLLAPFIYAFDVPSSDTATMQALADLADGLVVWGGEEAVRACRALAPSGCKLMEWGHRLSFAYVAACTDGELRDLAEHIVKTNGLLCSSCQVIFLDTEDLEDGRRFCTHFLPILEQAAQQHRTPSQRAQAALYAQEAQLEHIVDHNGRGTFFRGRGCSLTLGADRELELSPLHGNVLVKCLPRDQLLTTLRRRKGYLQTAGLLCTPEDRAELTERLSRSGVTRVTRAGTMSNAFPGEGHDGEYPLRRYVRAVDVEE